MGNYLNPGNEGFCRMVNSEIYIDKTGLLRYTNRVLNTMESCLSMAAAMLAAYYSRGCDSEELFSSFEIAQSGDFRTYLNRYDTIFLNMQEFLSQSGDMDGMLDLIR